MMQVVAQNVGKFKAGYSQLFEQNFLELLRMRHGTKRMRANVVYNEYIADKQHIHMNATRWTTLSGFVQYLGKTGTCAVDETEKGWFIAYIDRDPEKIARQRELAEMEKSRLNHEARNREFIRNQVKLAKQQGLDKIEEEEIVPLQRTDKEEKVKLQLVKSKSSSSSSSTGNTNMTRLFEMGKSSSASSSQPDAPTRKRSTLDELMEESERVKKRKLPDVRKENWIQRNLIVKVIVKDLAGGKYYKQKGRIHRVEDQFAAHVKMFESGDVLKLDQDDLETVIPQLGRRVRIVNGRGRGEFGTLLDLNLDDYCGRIRLESGAHSGHVLERVEYEDFCKTDNDHDHHIIN